MRYTLLYITLLYSFSLNGQMAFQDDTIKINEIVISRKNHVTHQAGYKKNSIDTSILKYYSHSTLAEVLSESTGIFVKSYGMGGIATLSFRGTGASHTLIDWNGINLNSPMLGQTDLSLIPVGLMDDIQICFGGASMSLNSGGIGGTINLQTKPVWKEETLVSMNSGFGSFGRYSGLVKVKTGNSEFQSVTRAFYQNSKNNFRYLNTVIDNDPIWMTRNNNEVLQKGIIQELYFHQKNSIISARVWYQVSDRNLPASLLDQQPNSGAKQFDEALRTILNYDLFIGKSNLNVTGAWFINKMNYSDNIAPIDSRNLSKTLTLKANFETPVGTFSKFKFILEEQSTVVNTNNYDHRSSLNTATLTVSLDKKKERIGTMFLVREILHRNKFLIPDFSTGLQFRLIDEKEYYLKANISRNSKIPTMNDMFWLPGGNPLLKNEYAFIYEVSYEMIQKVTAPLSFEFDLTGFHYSIKDMIQWKQGESIYWIADNINKVNSTGLESSLLFNYIQGSFKAKLRAIYSFTRANSPDELSKNGFFSGNQLVYVPANKANVLLHASFRNVYSSWVSDIVSKRFTTVDNLGYLTGYFLNSLSAGYKIKLKNTSADLSFRVENLFDVYYQTIDYFPLPGRSYSVKLLLQILK